MSSSAVWAVGSLTICQHRRGAFCLRSQKDLPQHGQLACCRRLRVDLSLVGWSAGNKKDSFCWLCLAVVPGEIILFPFGCLRCIADGHCWLICKLSLTPGHWLLQGGLALCLPVYPNPHFRGRLALVTVHLLCYEFYLALMSPWIGNPRLSLKVVAV